MHRREQLLIWQTSTHMLPLHAVCRHPIYSGCHEIFRVHAGSGLHWLRWMHCDISCHSTNSREHIHPTTTLQSQQHRQLLFVGLDWRWLQLAPVDLDQTDPKVCLCCILDLEDFLMSQSYTNDKCTRSFWSKNDILQHPTTRGITRAIPRGGEHLRRLQCMCLPSSVGILLLIHHICIWRRFCLWKMF